MSSRPRPGRAGAARAHLLLTGRVQGVHFRSTGQRRARALRLAGWARNLPDGRFEAVAEGDPRALARFVAWCGRGPEDALVRLMDVTFAPATGAPTPFIVRVGPGEDPPHGPGRSGRPGGGPPPIVRVRVSPRR
jgi:acylphosphatase